MNEKWEDILKLTNTIIAALTLVGVFLAWWALNSDYKWKKSQTLILLYQEWRTVMDKDSVRESISWVENGDNSKFLDEVASGKVPKDSALKPDDVAKYRRDTLAALNLFEEISVAWKEKIVHDDSINSYFREPINMHWEKLRPFISTYRKSFCIEPACWSAVDEFLKQTSRKTDNGHGDFP